MVTESTMAHHSDDYSMLSKGTKHILQEQLCG